MTQAHEIEALLAQMEAIGGEARRLRLLYYAQQGAKPLERRDGIPASGWQTLPRVEAVYQALIEALSDPDKRTAEIDEIDEVLKRHGRIEPRAEISTALSYLQNTRGSVE